MTDDAAHPGPTRTFTAADGRVFTIAPLVESDADEVARVHVQVWRETYRDLMPADYLAALDPAERAVSWRTSARRQATGQVQVRTLVARGGDGGIGGVGSIGGVVGFISAGPARDEDPPVPTQLWAINLLASVHGCGLAQELVRLALGEQDAYLWVADNNDRAIAFYRRLGFVQDGGRDEHEETGAAEVRMVRVSR